LRLRKDQGLERRVGSLCDGMGCVWEPLALRDMDASALLVYIQLNGVMNYLYGVCMIAIYMANLETFVITSNLRSTHPKRRLSSPMERVLWRADTLQKYTTISKHLERFKDLLSTYRH